MMMITAARFEDGLVAAQHYPSLLPFAEKSEFLWPDWYANGLGYCHDNIKRAVWRSVLLPQYHQKTRSVDCHLHLATRYTTVGVSCVELRFDQRSISVVDHLSTHRGSDVRVLHPPPENK